ncbi:MAG: ComEC/Rec2 family competence protein [Sphingomonadales bacterium]|nr:ComEC/Rec2 family competence protein [Sphingomonadales bacterium]MDE2570030.1 ComEC/Rec2 family competence protein [Sphingomonadales bacterium]
MASGNSAATRYDGIAPTRRHWDRIPRLSSVCCTAEKFLAERPFERGPWLAVAFAGGIAAWFALPGPWQWAALLATGGALVLAMLAIPRDNRFPHAVAAVLGLALMVAAGCVVVWTKSALVGAAPLERPMIASVTGRIADREVQPAQDRVRLVLDARVEGVAHAVRLRVNLPMEHDDPGLAEGATVRLRARLMPPAPPMLPGGYDFAASAWFRGLAATGSVLGKAQVLVPSRGGNVWRAWQHSLATHVRARLPGAAGGLAATFASGDRGGIPNADQEAMRDAGLTHLLSISGLHVSAVIAAAYLVLIRLLALSPWLALRVRLPLAAAGGAALAGIFYTLLTGAEVPTVRSCIGAVLVLGALAMGRDPLSMRLVAAAAVFVMLFWPEAVAGPSFQLSFAAVIAIVALHSSAPVKAFLARRDERWLRRVARETAMLLLTGVVIELSLMPIGLFHFHRAGFYGALANVVAIPLTTFVSMPLIALALFLDLAHAGAPAWWLTGKSLDLLLGIAHLVARQPGAVSLLPTMGRGAFLLFAAGGLWLGLWSGRVRMLGLVPVAIGAATLALTAPPDLLVTGDGRNVAIPAAGDTLLVLREGRSDYTRDNLREMAGVEGELVSLERWPGARCSPDFCSLALRRGGRTWRLLMTRGQDRVDTLELAAACERADIVVADRWLPQACRPRWIKADRDMLARTGGLAINLAPPKVTSVAERQGRHGWERLGKPPPRHPSANPGATGAVASEAASRKSVENGAAPDAPPVPQ